MSSDPRAAGDDDVDILGEELLRVAPCRAQRVGRRAPAGVDVGDRQLGSLGREQPGEVLADPAQADQGEAAAGQGGCAGQPPAHGPQRGERTQRGVRGGVPASAEFGRPAEHMRGGLGDDRHVGRPGSDVRAGRVRPVQGADDVGDVLEHGTPSLRAEACAFRQRDHRLPAAARQPGDRHLQGHARRQTQRVGETVTPVRVVPEPQSAGRRAERGGVNGEDHRQPGPVTHSDDNLFVIEHGPDLLPFVRDTTQLLCK
nr:hypothetical protein [Streptomyces fodineus]